MAILKFELFNPPGIVYTLKFRISKSFSITLWGSCRKIPTPKIDLSCFCDPNDTIFEPFFNGTCSGSQRLKVESQDFKFVNVVTEK